MADYSKNAQGNFKVLHRVSSSWICVLNFFILTALFACSPKSSLTEVQGDVSVRIPLVKQLDQQQADSEATYEIQTVTLRGLYNLKEVFGQFAQFFFAPGLTNGRLSGSAPQARFMKSAGGVYVPQDEITINMATLYYHMQKLSELNQILGVSDINQGPMPIGLQTRVSGQSQLKKNNAFYEGKSDAILFVPYTMDNLPIAVNSGIVAHEYFHSLFYKIVLKALDPSAAKKIQLPTSLKGIRSESVHSDLEWKDFKFQKVAAEVSLDEMTTEGLVNETLLRGLNEGLADFWAWAYTSDPNFLKWSLPSEVDKRSLKLQDTAIGVYENSKEITDRVISAQVDASNWEVEPSMVLSGYIYTVGTPHARFLKTLTERLSKSRSEDLNVTKIKVAQVVISYLRNLKTQMAAFSDKDTLPANSLFRFVGSEESNLQLNKSDCEFTLKYLKDDPKLAGIDCVSVAGKGYVAQKGEL